MARHNEIGRMGEDIAAKWLIQRGFAIIEQNYLKKWGEIDIVARGASGEVHFVEVKTVSYETKTKLEYAVSHETWRPEENVHRNKIDRFKRAIQTWVAENKYGGDWQTDIITLRLVPREKIACIKLIDNIILD
jgi:putative endonuclease